MGAVISLINKSRSLMLRLLFYPLFVFTKQPQ
uniref:Uncharacterized protein n=1 Tax=Myoviridae sp. ctcPl3 TaxID=2826669 RepID=A0A8S5QWE4_9CAUD|nr:MAG TPA: hypothetical protein [Myoviridae sp. ctcPl3]